jgi:hypothetical protein
LLLLTTSNAAHGAGCDGVKATFTVDVFPAARLATEVLLDWIANSAAFGPTIVTEKMLIAVVPLFALAVSVTAWAALVAPTPEVNVKGPAGTCNRGVPVVAGPAPLNPTVVEGALGSLVEMISVPLTEPVAVGGVNETVRTPLSPADRTTMPVTVNAEEEPGAIEAWTVIWLLLLLVTRICRDPANEPKPSE